MVFALEILYAHVKMSGFCIVFLNERNWCSYKQWPALISLANTFRNKPDTCLMIVIISYVIPKHKSSEGKYLNMAVFPVCLPNPSKNATCNYCKKLITGIRDCEMVSGGILTYLFHEFILPIKLNVN